MTNYFGICSAAMWKEAILLFLGLKLFFFFPQLWDVPGHVNHHRRVAINDGVSYVAREKETQDLPANICSHEVVKKVEINYIKLSYQTAWILTFISVFAVKWPLCSL